MEKKLIGKMIQNCFKQYYPDVDSLPINNREFENICNKIVHLKRENPKVDLYEIINDAVYEFLTD